MVMTTSSIMRTRTIEKNMKTILIMGLPGSGKSSLLEAIKDAYNGTVYTLNADKVRTEANDWDFSKEGIIRQAKRMASLAEKTKLKSFIVDSIEKDILIVDFICPTYETRSLFNADIIIWMDTVKECEFEDTNKLFQNPSFSREKIHCHVTTKNAQKWAKHIIETIL
jgi:adenylylsulfate kinase